MIPHNPADAPSVDLAVLKRLKRLDPSLKVTWSRWHLDPATGAPVRARYPAGAFIEDPHFYLWRKSDTCSHYFLVKMYERFDDRAVLGLERDVARFIPANEIAQRNAQLAKAKTAREKAAFRERKQDHVTANRSLINDIVFDGKRSTRDGKIFSAAGVARRGSTGSVRQGAKEFGWENPSDKGD